MRPARDIPLALFALLSLAVGCGRIAPGSVASRSVGVSVSGGGGYSGGGGGYVGPQCYGASGCAHYSNTTDPGSAGYVRPAR